MAVVQYGISGISSLDTSIEYLVAVHLDEKSIHIGFWNGYNLVAVQTSELDQVDLNALGDLNISKIIVLNTDAPFIHIDYNTFEPNEFSTYFTNYGTKSRFKSKLAQYEKLKDRKIYTLHYSRNVVSSLFKNLTSNIIYYHVSSGMANTIRNSDDQLLCYLGEDDKFHVSLKKEGQFNFYNQFVCTSKEDYLYYILLVLKQFELDSDTFPIVVGGNIQTSSALTDFIKFYIGNLSFYQNPRFKIDGSTKDSHIFLPFIMAKECG